MPAVQPAALEMLFCVLYAGEVVRSLPITDALRILAEALQDGSSVEEAAEKLHEQMVLLIQRA